MSFDLGIRPAGDELLRPGTNCRAWGLGRLAGVSDEKLLDVLPYLSWLDLGRLCSVSTACYVLSHTEDIWKSLVLQHMDSHSTESCPLSASWKGTYLNLKQPGGGYTAVQPSVGAKWYYSDVLYKPVLCRSVDLESLVQSANCSIDRRHGLSASQFRAEYEMPNVPVVLTDIVSSWPAYSKWAANHLLKEFGGGLFHAGGLEVPLSDYLSYASSTGDELPFYIFDKHFGDKFPTMLDDIAVPHVFEDDLFNVLGSSRPDYRWLIAGPVRSGSTFHVDPNNTSAWNAVIQGRKKWVMFPPHVTPPGVHPSADGLDLATPVSVVEWFLDFYEECARQKIKPLECVVNAGEVIFVPHGWWHCVLNLEWSVAITQNFVSWANLPGVLDVLLHKKHLISGVALQHRHSIGDRFVEALRAHHGQKAEEALADTRQSAAALPAVLRSRTFASVFDRRNGAADGQTSRSKQARLSSDGPAFSFGFAL